VRIARNAGKEALLLSALRESFDEPRTGVHLSDLLSVRESHYKTVVPMPLTETQIGYFASGRSIEDVVARLAGIQGMALPAQRVKIPGLIAGEQRFKHGISYRPDFRWTRVPVEFKSRRAEFAKEGLEAERYDHYLEQLKGYCALDEEPEGGLWLFDIGGSCPDCFYTREPSFAFYDVTFMPAELEQMEAALIERRDARLKALTGGIKGGWMLPLCSSWKCGKSKKTVTTEAKCGAEGCEVKHRKEKAGHVMSPEVATWTYIQKCPFYNFCQPQSIDPKRGPRVSDGAV
jgi:hypothetical protein